LTPLRSIPFRVVCLLGMNADAFPRNHERAGFDLMGRHRRIGDPARRDDDRYLFLESLIAARECLYISHVARDERSNARREPALPLSELRDYVDTHWSKDATGSLTRSHHLKPFNARYFEPGGELFSYRREWLPAARPGARAAGFDGATLAPLPAAALTVDELTRFYRNPCRAFFVERFGVRFHEPGDVAQDCEPLALDTLQEHGLKRELVNTAFASAEAREVDRMLLARGELPLGQVGVELLQGARAKVSDLVERIADWSRLEPRSVEIQLEIGSRPLRGTIGGLRDARLREFTPSSEARGNAFVAFWIHHLCACAARVLDGASTLDDGGKTHTLELLDADTARAHLADLIVLHDAGMCRPLPLFPKSAFAWARSAVKKGNEELALKTARKEFDTRNDVPGEGDDRYIARVYPDADQALGVEFEDLARRVFLPLAGALAREGS
ncbi:MAG: exodeoxyribonuclease V subunit gamma, partial [Pseudomonadales bacterium]|nr:exodeoxyribonuclease V subunit gamma [Pseudomonadales bacterium]